MEMNFNDEKIPELESIKGSGYLHDLMKIVDSIAEEISKQNINQFQLSDLYKVTDNGVMANIKKLEEYGAFNTKSVDKRKSKLNNEFEGLYVLVNDSGPVYTGISRKIIKRLRNHGWGKSSSTSTLAYLMARTEKKIKNANDYNDKGKEDIRKTYTKKIRAMKVFIFPYPKKKNEDETQEYYSLQLLEVLVSIKLKTKWNSFKSH